MSSSSICLVYHLDPSGDARGLPRLNLCLFPGHLVRLRGALRIFHRFFCPYTKGDLELRRQNLYNRQDELAVGRLDTVLQGCEINDSSITYSYAETRVDIRYRRTFSSLCVLDCRTQAALGYAGKSSGTEYDEDCGNIIRTFDESYLLYVGLESRTTSSISTRVGAGRTRNCVAWLRSRTGLKSISC